MPLKSSRRRRRPSARPRITVGGVAGVCTLLLLVGGAVQSPSFVSEGAGPTFNTIGKSNGKDLISISGRKTYSTSGTLSMTTVYVSGGPNSATNDLAVLSSWMHRDQSVYPAAALYPPETTRQQVSQQNVQEMDDAQSSAQVAAAKYLKMDYTTTLTVRGTTQDAAAHGIPQGAVLTTLDGKKLTSYDQLTQALADGKGKKVSLGYRTKDKKDKTLEVTPKKDQKTQKYQLGLYLHQDYDLPFDVHYGLENVGGPSAGMMFTLGIIDELTPGAMTGGKHFAGTGTIAADGTVGPIGGIQQKLVGARHDGATVFLAPADNCSDVVGHVPDGLKVIKVSTLSDAVKAVTEVGQGKDPSSFPQCTSGS